MTFAPFVGRKVSASGKKTGMCLPYERRGLSQSKTRPCRVYKPTPNDLFEAVQRLSNTLPKEMDRDGLASKTSEQA